jgi:hypothetical protein
MAPVLVKSIVTALTTSSTVISRMHWAFIGQGGVVPKVVQGEQTSPLLITI